MKTHVKALVVGGGAVGTSIAYHLQKAGWDTMLVERDELTSGSTWHAAGLLPLFNMSYATTHIHKYSVDFYKGLEAETGLNAGFSICGNLRMAQTVFMTRDRDMARRLMEQKVTIRNLERQSAQRHLIRLREGQTESRETSSLHLDLLRDLKRINAHAVSVAHPILQDEGLLIESRLRGS